MSDFSTTGYFNYFTMDFTPNSPLWSFDDKTQADSSYAYYSYFLFDVTSPYYFIKQGENDFTTDNVCITSPDISTSFRIYDTSLATIDNTDMQPKVCQGYYMHEIDPSIFNFLRSPQTIDDTTGSGSVFSPIGGDHIIKVSEIK